jgi:hypothetical protein
VNLFGMERLNETENIYPLLPTSSVYLSRLLHLPQLQDNTIIEQYRLSDISAVIDQTPETIDAVLVGLPQPKCTEFFGGRCTKLIRLMEEFAESRGDDAALPQLPPSALGTFLSKC